MRYQFHDQPPYDTVGVVQAEEALWNDTHVILLGTVDRQLLVEYLRGPSLVLELHDRARRPEDCTVPTLFGEETRDDVLGTHAFTAGNVRSMLKLACASNDTYHIDYILCLNRFRGGCTMITCYDGSIRKYSTWLYLLEVPAL